MASSTRSSGTKVGRRYGEASRSGPSAKWRRADLIGADDQRRPASSRASPGLFTGGRAERVEALRSSPGSARRRRGRRGLTSWRTYIERMALGADHHAVRGPPLGRLRDSISSPPARMEPERPILITLTRPELPGATSDWGAGRRSFLALDLAPLMVQRWKSGRVRRAPPGSAAKSIVARAEGIRCTRSKRSDAGRQAAFRSRGPPLRAGRRAWRLCRTGHAPCPHRGAPRRAPPRRAGAHPGRGRWARASEAASRRVGAAPPSWRARLRVLSVPTSCTRARSAVAGRGQYGCRPGADPRGRTRLALKDRRTRRWRRPGSNRSATTFGEPSPPTTCGVQGKPGRAGGRRPREPGARVAASRGGPGPGPRGADPGGHLPRAGRRGRRRRCRASDAAGAGRDGGWHGGPGRARPPDHRPGGRHPGDARRPRSMAERRRPRSSRCRAPPGNGAGGVAGGPGDTPTSAPSTRRSSTSPDAGRTAVGPGLRRARPTRRSESSSSAAAGPVETVAGP